MSLSAGVMARRGTPDHTGPHIFWKVSAFLSKIGKILHVKGIFFLDPKSFQVYRLLFFESEICPILPGHMPFLVPFSAKWLGVFYELK